MQDNNMKHCSSAECGSHIGEPFNMGSRSSLVGVEKETSQLSVCEETDSETDNVLLITSLPEVVLVNVMKYLSLMDRYHLSITCRLFYSLFSHPHLWRVAHISLCAQQVSSGRSHRWKLRSIMHDTMTEIVRRFSHLFQHLSLEMFHHVQPFDDDCRRMLEQLNKECRLESLCLRLGSLASIDEHVQRRSAQGSNFDDLPLIVGLIKRAVRLKRLTIIAWPLHSTEIHKHDIFQALMSNEKLTGLESLSIFYVEAKSEAWTERNPKLPSQEMTLQLASHFRSLTHLALRSPMVNNEIIFELASKSRSKLSLLQILIVFSKNSAFQEGYTIPEVSSKAWNALKRSSPELKVEYLTLTRIPQEQMNLMLKPEVPLFSMSVLTYGKCDQEMIEILTEHYKYSLEKFTCLCETEGCDQALVNLVASCTQLQHLVYHGNICYKTVIKIAEIIKEKGLMFNCFEFKQSNIQTNFIASAEGRSEDLVVARDDDSDGYYLVGLRSWHEDGDRRKSILDEMAEVVSRNLGYRWQPVA